MNESIIVMIPARMGSQRLKKKNLRTLAGIPLVVRALRKCVMCDLFDEVWLNSENTYFADIASAEGVQFHKRPDILGGNDATSEQYISEFLLAHDCDWLVQVHSIAPLLSQADICSFVQYVSQSSADVVLSYEPIQIECAFNEDPINFTFKQKTNSQDLTPIRRISWSITAWRRKTFLKAVKSGECATYFGNIDYYPVNSLASHVIKTEQDLTIAEALLPLIDKP